MIICLENIGVKCNINEKGSILKYVFVIKIYCVVVKGIVGCVDKIIIIFLFKNVLVFIILESWYFL